MSYGHGKYARCSDNGGYGHGQRKCCNRISSIRTRVFLYCKRAKNDTDGKDVFALVPISFGKNLNYKVVPLVI